MEFENNKNSLGEGYLLHWYEIKKILGRGGFGITYLAHDNNLGRFVAIKEFMPEDFASRDSTSTVHPKTDAQKELYDWGLQRFIDEARTLAHFTHPNIVRVLSVFEENNTAYMVMEYAQGKDLSGIFKKSATMSEDALLDIFIPIMDGLALVHNAGFIHRDIKPANIYICDHNSPLLLDFGSARQSVSGKTQALTSLVTYGYAPFEQYNEGAGKQGPWTDIYSLGASIYMGITGKKPVDAMARGGSLLDKNIDCYEPVSVIARGQYSEHFLLAVDRALMFKVEDRPVSSLEFADMLLGKIAPPPLPQSMLLNLDDDATIVRPRSANGSYKQTSPTGTKSSTQGLVDAQGRRNSGRVSALNDSENNSQRNTQSLQESQPASKKSAIKIWSGVIAAALITLALLIGYKSFKDDAADSKVLNPHENTSVAIVASKNKSQKEFQRKPPENLNNLAAQTKTKISRLLESAEREFSAGNYVKPAGKSAYDFYRKILKQQKNNVDAKQGIRNIEKELLSLASSAYFNKAYVQASDYLQQLNSVNPKSKTAQSLRKRVTAEKNKSTEVSRWLTQAEKHLKAKRYTSPKNNNAYALLTKVLSRQPENRQALKGIKKIQTYYFNIFEKHLSAARLKQADRTLRVIKNLDVSASAIRDMQSRLNAKKKQQTRKSSSTKVQFKKLTIEQVGQKISQFKAAIQSGDKETLNRISDYVAGRERFVNQLLVKYQSITVKISRLQLIGSKNIAKARVELTELIDVNGEIVAAGDWGKFGITLRYNKKNELKIVW